MNNSPIIDKKSFSGRGLLLGERLDLRAFGKGDWLADAPLTIAIRGGGVAVLFRYGAAVLFDVTSTEQASFLEQMKPFVIEPFAEYETEEVEIRIEAEAREGVQGASLILQDCSVERLQIVADILSKSMALARYEGKVNRDFDRIEPFAMNLEQQSSVGRNARELLSHIGGALLSEHKMIGRVQVDEKPELIWERPDLERLFLRLEDEYEISERYAALNQKLELISRTAETVLELLQHRRSLRVEWYIVILIVLEIILNLSEKFFHR